ncbi:MAG: galactokinase [Armatimonadota bacterium]
MTPLSSQFLRRRFAEQFQRPGEQAVIVRAPGRLNLLGEHTDYNDGFVLPIAIDRATWIVAALAGNQVRVWSEAKGEEDRFDPAAIVRSDTSLWTNYVRGVLWALGEDGISIGGADLLIAGDLPLSAGVSSSASLETAAALAFLALAGREMAPREVALLCQHAEHKFAGVNCGIMDQFAVGLSQADHALLLDCRNLETRAVPLAGDAPVFFVCDTSKPRTLAASAYNQRRAECEGAARSFGMESLRDVTLPMIDRDRERLGETVYRRCRHVITENERVLQAPDVMAQGDWDTFGRLLQQSHDSLRRDYEVSCDELDIMCELAQQHPGCLGARMVGAGFGGCAMAAVERVAVEGFGEALANKYRKATGREPRIFAVQAAPGASILV